MKKKIIFLACFVLIIEAAIIHGQADPNDPNQLQEPARLSFIRKVSFFTRDGEQITGKLVFRDDNRLAVEVIEESRLQTLTFNDKQIDTRTIQFNTVPEYQYLMDTAEFFMSNTWDLRDDPDEFILAIRALEKAQRLLSRSRPDSNVLAEITNKIQELKADRQTWIQQTRDRAELKELELEATIDTRLRSLEEGLQRFRGDVNDMVTNIRQSFQDAENRDEQVLTRLQQFQDNLERQLDVLNTRIEANRIDIYEIERDMEYYYPQRYHYRRRYYFDRD